jgi:hypothetical protein
MAPSQLLLLQRQTLHCCRATPLPAIEKQRWRRMASSEQNDDIPHCPNCDLPMTCIGVLPGISDRPGVEVFRCPHCNAVITREF